MIILHAGFFDHQLWLWGEVPAGTAPETSARRGRRTPAKARKRERLPFDAGADGLLAALNEVVSSLKMSKDAVKTVAIWLPMVDGQPIASSPIIAEPPPSNGKAVIAPWAVAAIPLNTAETVDLLCRCVNRETLAAGVIVGNDLAFWVAAMRLGGAMTAREQFLPTVEPVEDFYRARWEPVFAGAEAQRLQRLAKAMPHACRALTAANAEAAPESPMSAALAPFVGEMVDYLVRSGSAPKKVSSVENAHDQWLSALQAPDGVMEGSAAKMAELAAQTREWRRPIMISAAAPFRLCFRLEEPEEETGRQGDGGTGRKEKIAPSPRRPVSPSQGWHVRYLLQAADDPSLLIPVADAWKARGRVATALKRGKFEPREYLLSALGQAAGLSSYIEQSLKTVAPGGYDLDAAGAHDFLTEKAWVLEQAGYGVMLPAWWTRKGAKLRLSMRATVRSPKLQAGGGLTLDRIIEFDWQVALGGEALSLEELQALANLKSPLVQFRGQWVQLNADEIQAALDFWKKKATDKATMRDVVQMALGRAKTPGGLAFDGVTADGWIGDFLAQLDGRSAFEELPVPDQFHGVLRPYQTRGYSWLGFLKRWGLGACLADDMGLGKCVGPDALIVVNGMLLRSEDVWSCYAGEASFDGAGYWANPTNTLGANSIDERTGRITQTQIRRLYRQRVHERLRKITLEDGSEITVTRAHKLLTSRGWTNELRVGDYICTPAKVMWEGQSEDPDLVKFLAWQLAEGYELLDKSEVRITQKEVSVLEDLRQSMRRFSEKSGIEINSPSVCRHNGKAPALRLCSVGYRRFLERRGYEWGKLSREKSIPPFIMQADLESLLLFLRNYFDAEASVVESMRSIEISTASPTLIQQLSHLLRRFGIWLRISAKQKCATNGSRIFRTYYIGTMSGNAARQFCAEIGFSTPEKQRRLEKICERRSNTNVEGIPASEIVAQTIAATHLPVRHFGMHTTVYLDGSQQFSRASLERVVTHFDLILSGEAEQKYKQAAPSKWTAHTLNAYAHLDRQQLIGARRSLMRLLDQEIFYCRIKTIEDVEYEGWVYDFEVETHHNFVANNILCHNTVQALALIEREWHANGKRPTLLVCPTSVISNWQKEAARFTPDLPVMVHHGVTRAKGEAFKKDAAKHALVVSSYPLLQRDSEILKDVDWSGVILDEAQNVKNPETKQSRAARALKSDYRVALTGTPVENDVGDLWAIMEFLNPGFLGAQSEFKKTFFIPIQAQRDAEASARLKRLTGPFILRRLKTDKTIIADLPEKNEMKVFCTLTKEQASLYAAVAQDAIRSIGESEGIQRKGQVLATLVKLKQVCNHPAQFLGDNSAIPGRSGKLARLTEMLEEALSAGDRALVFSQFAEMGGIVQKHLQETFGREVLFLHGATPKKHRDRMVERFQASNGNGDSPRVFVLSLKAGGTGLNLTAANHVFHFDRWWNPAVENQATDRAFRIGQTRNVQVHKFICAGTLEDKIDEMIERKQAIAASIVGAGENWLTELSTDQLKELFALRRDAVGE